MKGWVPCAIRTDGSKTTVEWCYVGEAKFADPFFEETIQRSMLRPFNQMFARQTTAETLADWASGQPGVPPGGFIFHASRCGSTLISQMAAALPHAIAISEAPPIDQVLRSHLAAPERIAIFRGLLSAFGQRRAGDERFLFVKFDAWHVLDLPLVQNAFTGVPCMFLYRRPEEIIASQMRMPGIQTIPGVLDPAVLGLQLEDAMQMRREEYCARLLAVIFDAAIEHALAGRVTLMNYLELPQGASRQLLRWAGLSEDDPLRERIEAIASFDAKTPSMPYDAGAIAARPAPSAAVVAASEQFATKSYERLESIRLGHGVSLSPRC